MIDAIILMSEAGRSVGAELCSHYGYEALVGPSQSMVKFKIEGRTTKEFYLQHNWTKEEMASEIKQKINETFAIK